MNGPLTRAIVFKAVNPTPTEKNGASWSVACTANDPSTLPSNGPRRNPWEDEVPPPTRKTTNDVSNVTDRTFTFCFGIRIASIGGHH